MTAQTHTDPRSRGIMDEQRYNRSHHLRLELITAVSKGTATVSATSGNFWYWVTIREGEDTVSRDRKALMALCHSINGPNWSNSMNWLSNLPLNAWHGVQGSVLGEVA